ncbi:MAG: energy-coupling factor transporter transmembrane protein EcfT [bacterium]|jgi:energy-coupling factor transport system permease protein|nr:energy-coupling factor transporter transmembrane protein EcfT [bacterium]
MDNIIIGQYIPGNSLIHRLDARIKISILIIMIVALFVAHTIVVEAILLVFILFLIISSRIPILKVLKGLRAILFLVCFTAVLQLGNVRTGDFVVNNVFMHMTVYNLIIIFALIFIYIFTRKYIPFRFIYLLLLCALSFVLQYYFTSGVELFKYEISFTDEGLIRVGFIVLRLLNLVLLSSVLTFTTSPMDLKNGLESLMKPLKVIKVPVAEIAMMISLVLRFIPTLLEETNKIIKAQASRGADFNEAGLRQKMKQIISLLVPMFVVSFKRADDLANAMESRGYVIGEKRTSIDVLKLTFKDYFALFLILTLLAFVIMGAVTNADIWSVYKCALR